MREQCWRETDKLTGRQRNINTEKHKDRHKKETEVYSTEKETDE